MSLKKDCIMQEMQRFGGAMYTPVILFAFFGLTVALSIVCKNPGIIGSIADKGTVWYDFWFVVEQGAWTVFAQMPILFAIAVPIGFAKKEQARCAMESFVIYKDSTFAMMREAQRRGHQIVACEPRHISWQSGSKVMARVREMLRYSPAPFGCDVVLFSLDNQPLGMSRPLPDIAEVLA